VVTAFVVAVALSYFGVRTAVAEEAAEQESAKGLELAVRLEPENPDYWYRLGHFQQFNLEQPDASRAELYFRRALALDPRYTNAWLDLGTNYELEGDAKEAREAFLRAKLSYPASAEVSWRYGNFLLREGDLPGAYAELRRALRIDPRRAASAFSRCYRADPDIAVILEQLLPAEPGVYVDVIAESSRSNQLAVAQIVWKRLLALHPRLEIHDFDPLIGALMNKGEFTEARQVWEQGVATMTLPALLQPKAGLIWDPSFESGVNGSAFSWRYQPLVQGMQTTLDSTQELSGSQSLRLTFDGRHNPNLEAACTEAIVEPNTNYHFSGWIKTQELTTNSGVAFRLRPIGDPNAAVQTTRDVRGTAPWTYVDTPFSPGPQVHRVVICIIREPSDTPDARISGTAWVDDVNLIPQSAETHKP